MAESRFAVEPFRLALAAPRLARTTKAPATVIVLPGLGGNDASTIPLRWYLKRLGHQVEGWELGLHGPDVNDTLDRFLGRLTSRDDDREVTLVGWSLGGVVAREIARERPALIRQVITFGSPINRFPRARPIRVPVTTIYSRNDGVVHWRDAIDHTTPGVVNVEVGSSHLGLGIDPDVWRTIADAIDGAGPTGTVARHRR